MSRLTRMGKKIAQLETELQYCLHNPELNDYEKREQALKLQNKIEEMSKNISPEQMLELDEYIHSIVKIT